jgi:hypothetical protein
LPTLLPAAQLVNDRSNVTQLEGFLRLFEAFKEGGDISQLQVDQVEQQLLQGRSTVLQDELVAGNLLDQFKLQLGLPVNIPLELDDSPVRPLMRQFQDYLDVFSQFDKAREEATGQGPPAESARLRPHLREVFGSTALVRETRFRDRLRNRWSGWETLADVDLTATLTKLGDERRKLLDTKTNLEQAGRKLSDAQQKRMAELDFEIDLGGFERLLRLFETQPWLAQQEPERRQRQHNALFQNVINAFTLVLGEARNERIDKLRGAWPDLPKLCLGDVDLLQVEEAQAQAAVAQAALINRFDLMNARAQVVDAWRQIAVFANALLGVLNVEYHLDTFTPFGQAKPLAFGGSRNRHQLILNGQLPLVRVQERNNYRAALIAYQRQRRSLMESEDLIVTAVRAEIRQLRVLAENYKIQQRQVELAYATVESSLDTFRAPPAPTPAGGSALNTAVSAASLTQQLLSAQRSLPSAQNQLLSVWISYLTTRIELYRDLELMQFDPRGAWIDDPAACACAPGRPGEISGGGPASQRRPGVGDEGALEVLPEVRPLLPAEAPPLGGTH